VKSTLLALACLCLPLSACEVFFGSGDDDGRAPDAQVIIPTPDAAIDATPGDASPCNPVVAQFVVAESPHIEEGKPMVYPLNPPSSGPHYPVWARWDGSYGPGVLARPYWVHNLEHGGVVFLYNCPSGCPDVVTGLEQLQSSLPADPLCVAPVRTRTLVTSDSLLPADVPIAASAWGFTYTASCFDAPSLRAFYEAHHGHASEDLCAQGARPTTP
jgi:hypothetical protein